MFDRRVGESPADLQSAPKMRQELPKQAFVAVVISDIIMRPMNADCGYLIAGDRENRADHVKDAKAPSIVLIDFSILEVRIGK